MCGDTNHPGDSWLPAASGLGERIPFFPTYIRFLSEPLREGEHDESWGEHPSVAGINALRADVFSAPCATVPTPSRKSKTRFPDNGPRSCSGTASFRDAW